MTERENAAVPAHPARANPSLRDFEESMLRDIGRAFLFVLELVLGIFG